MTNTNQPVTVDEIVTKWARNMELPNGLGEANCQKIRTEVADKMNQAIRQAFEAVMIKKIDTESREHVYLRESDEGQRWFDKGMNEAIDQIQSRMKEVLGEK